MATEQFQLTPPAVEKRFQRLLKRRAVNPRADDPLFRPVDADDFRLLGDEASDCSNLRQNALVRVPLALPPNIRLVDPVSNQPSDETVVDIWRSVPSVLNVKLTGSDGVNPWLCGPNTTGGYQLDARFLTLQDQALGALVAHSEIRDPPSQRMLDDLSSFQRVLFSSPRVRALSEAVERGVTPLPDIDPRLTALERQGKGVFERSCAQCHGGAGQSTTLPNGATERRTTSDPGRALLTGFVGGPPSRDDWGKLDMPGLRGLARTAPYFHNNSADTLEAVVDHYIEFFKLVKVTVPPGTPLPSFASSDGVSLDRAVTAEERAALAAYMRKL